MTNYKDTRIGRLTVLDKQPPKGNRIMWSCLCDCGTTVFRRSDSLATAVKGTRVASCGCYKKEIITGMNNKRALRPFEALYNIFSDRASRRGVDFFTYSEFVYFTETKECHYCGETLRWKQIGARGIFQGYNIDRKDNKIGYVKDNCIPCCGRCNLSRADRFTYEEWLQIGKLIGSWKK